jgi:hypothetical protein
LPQVIGDINLTFFGGTWSRDGTILFANGALSNGAWLVRVSERGGSVADVLKPDRERGQASLIWPTFLPDGRHFLYLAWSAQAEKRAIYAGSLDGGPRHS